MLLTSASILTLLAAERFISLSPVFANKFIFFAVLAFNKISSASTLKSCPTPTATTISPPTPVFPVRSDIGPFGQEIPNPKAAALALLITLFV